MTESNRSRRDLIKTAAGLTVATPLAGCNVDVRRKEAEDAPAPTPERGTDTPTDTPEPTPEETDTPEPSEENKPIYIGDIPDTAGWAWPDNYPLRTIHEKHKERVAERFDLYTNIEDQIDPLQYDPENEEDLVRMMEKGIDVGHEVFDENGIANASNFTENLAEAIGQFCQNKYEIDYEVTATGGDSHGWAYLWMEGIHPKLIDINAGVGDIGENHLENHPGTDKIGKFLDGEQWRLDSAKGSLMNIFSYNGIDPEDHNGTMIADDAVRPIYEQIMEDPELARTMVRPAMAAAWGAHINNEDGIYMITDPDLPVFDPELNTTQYSTKGVETGEMRQANKAFREHYQELMENNIELMTVEEAKKHL